MAREDAYIAQLKEMEIWQPAFEPAVHDLCVLEREYSRAMKLWRDDAKERGTVAQASDPLYAPVLQLRREIASGRESLGLTPRGLQKLRGRPKGEGGVAGEAMSRKLDELLALVRSYDETPAGADPGQEAAHE